MGACLCSILLNKMFNSWMYLVCSGWEIHQLIPGGRMRRLYEFDACLISVVQLGIEAKVRFTGTQCSSIKKSAL